MTIDEYNTYVVLNWNRKKSKDMTKLKSLYIMTAGLGGETGEVLETLKKHVRDGTKINKSLALECGDVLHYLVKVANEFGYTLQDLIDMNVRKLDKRYGYRKDQ
jgi:NTP pyrophosphatase (non-canonical NTP hydrolase)